MMITQWAGINVITAYMVNIFIMSGSSVDPSLAPILVCCVQQSLATCSTLVLRVSPRKPLFLLCACAIAVCQARRYIKERAKQTMIKPSHNLFNI